MAVEATKIATMTTISIGTIDTIYNAFNHKAIKIEGTPNIDTV
jgi:hypothetical protein